jgi:hypothetical protein
MKRITAGLVAIGCLLIGIAIGSWLPLLGPSSTLTPRGAAEQATATLAIVDPLERQVRWGNLLARAEADSLPALRDAIANAPIEQGYPEVISFAMWWAGFDPQAALEWTNVEWRAQARPVVGSILRVWAHRDPEAALAQVSRVPAFHYLAALDGAIVGWHESGKPGLIEQAQSLPEGTFRQQLAESLARRLTLSLGFERAMEWVASVSDPTFRDEMSRRIASAAAERGDSAVIATWATPFVTAGTERASGYPRRIGTRWIIRDPAAALAWLESLPAGRDRDDGVLESYRDWARYAPAAARAWIQNAELERWSEPAFSIYARRMGKERPEEALALVARFSDEPLRTRITASIVRKWHARDPRAAEAWLAKADVPEQVRRVVSQQRTAGNAN